MKLVRFGAHGAEKPGIVDRDGTIRDLSAHVPDFSGANLAPAALAKLAAIDPSSLPKAPDGVRLGPPVAGTHNFIAIGLNYADHAKETGQEIPSEPILFNKATTSICGPNDDVMIPRNSRHTDWECEIAFVIGARARYVEAKDWANYIAGYCICNDVSERSFQSKRGGQWVKGKSAETFGPIGPWLVTPDEIPNVDNLAMSLDVNGVRKQTGSTATMIFNIPFLLAYVTEFMVLEPGDIISTGTPPGVGTARNPREFLKAGDVVELNIEGLGTQRQNVVPFAL
ncbi:putative Isomerase/Decarboxylase related protein family; putative 2-hydroxyhepta-2,4-diene-1,7-dioate isomerase [Hyphomicrobium sp. GJ21]|uniref:fumarylacetoacetate hydrolase family protein n=1 Tax=Hyphomicrobium sp. GJ21 TaxID=113574 RepID=UPI000622BE1B|nr:fumarylacetoacetate hydrolase family protein [Hyphomicrobium sp. GJ21]CEJ87747.1 putative Isomerase/Decarboxylase related protein family; putative 2-hydroxyhepta-2,4-diene-1,7-dioate isomerase [Hyphomicrobium sp. GJ21]